ncbi:unnamed protein product [Durusdinium trenchii]|uniref:Uncharacterized protein n=1 Tax=Durusdinium trenchii TaxID=1381693 RepID=A0ABP0KB41_9DINO
MCLLLFVCYVCCVFTFFQAPYVGLVRLLRLRNLYNIERKKNLTPTSVRRAILSGHCSGSLRFRLRTKQLQVIQKSNDIVAKTISGILPMREDSGISSGSPAIFAHAQPVFQSDAEVEAAYRDAFGPATAPGQETDYESAEEFPGWGNRPGAKAAEALALASYN